MAQVAHLAQDVVRGDAQGKGADVLGDGLVPVPLRTAVALGIASEEIVIQLGPDTELVRRGIAARHTDTVLRGDDILAARSGEMGIAEAVGKAHSH